MPSKSLLLGSKLVLWGILEQIEQRVPSGRPKKCVFLLHSWKFPFCNGKRREDHEHNFKAHNPWKLAGLVRTAALKRWSSGRRPAFWPAKKLTRNQDHSKRTLPQDSGWSLGNKDSHQHPRQPELAVKSPNSLGSTESSRSPVWTAATSVRPRVPESFGNRSRSFG